VSKKEAEDKEEEEKKRGEGRRRRIECDQICLHETGKWFL